MTIPLDACWAAGRLVSRAEAGPGLTDRSFRYGDGVFVTMSLREGRLLDAEAQLARLGTGASFIDLDLPPAVAAVEALASVLESLGGHRIPDCVVRIQVSAGSGRRGYGRSDRTAWELVELLPAPRPRRLSVTVLEDGEVPSAAYPAVKSCSALAHVRCAAAAARRGTHEAIRVCDGVLLEAAAANLFWAAGDTLCTPSASLPLYPGVTRAVVLEAATRLGWTIREEAFAPGELETPDGAFLTSATRGVEPMLELDGRTLAWPAGLERLREAVQVRRREQGYRVDVPDVS
jgi:branched-subunit amino acid aminotransferase/4-amino-4-deoxychorismate lyase